MKTWTTLVNLYKSWTDSSSDNETLGGQMLNDSIRAVASIRSGRWKWLETVETIDTVYQKQNYPFPNNIRHAVDIYVQTDSGGAIWFPEIVYDPVIWKKVLSAKLGYGDIPRFIYIQDKTM